MEESTRKERLLGFSKLDKYAEKQRIKV